MVKITAQFHEFVMKHFGFTPEEFYYNPKILVEKEFEIAKKYGFLFNSPDYLLYALEAQALGAKIIMDGDNLPEVDSSNPVITSLDGNIVTPNFNKGIFALITEMYEEWCRVTDREDVDIQFTAPFTLTGRLFGEENFYLEMAVNSETTLNLINKVTDKIILPWVLHLIKLFPKAENIIGADANCFLSSFSLDDIEKFALNPLEKIREACKGKRVFIPNWGGESRCNKKFLSKIMELKYRANPYFIEGQSTDVEILSPQHYVDEAKKYDIDLVLGLGARFIDCSKLEAIAKLAKKYILFGKEIDDFTFYFCNLSRITPEENILETLKVIKKEET